MNALGNSLKAGFARLRENPQLAYSILVALVIAFSFIFVSNRFIGIAKSAEDNLINVRVGSIHDAFAAYVRLHSPYSTDIETMFRNVANDNTTISQFKLIGIENGKETLYASLDLSAEKGTPSEIAPEDAFLYNLAKSDPSRSFTTERYENGERFFKTARAIADVSGEPKMLVTVQSLSEADKKIASEIRASIFILFLILFAVLLLFFRHSRIIDYGVLYKRLREIDTLKDDFIAMASHELRTPLAAIKGYAELLLDRESEENDKQIFSKNILTSVRNLDSLVADILDVARIEQGRIEVKLANCKTGELVSDVVDSLKKVASDKGLSLAVEIQDDLLALVDRDRLRQVFVNLIGNAIKYTQKGNIKVTQKRENNRVVICVADTGIGMTKQEQGKIFEKFYRVKSEETKEIGGTGLGLWITRQLVLKMSGSIYIESIKGVGTHAYVSFPIVHSQ